jgi:hypothetical protein
MRITTGHPPEADKLHMGVSGSNPDLHSPWKHSVRWLSCVVTAVLLLVGLRLAGAQTLPSDPSPSTVQSPAGAGLPGAGTPPLAENLSTANCDPCRFKIAETLAPYLVHFQFQSFPNDDHVIQSLQISRDDKPGWSQSLPVHDMDPTSKGEEFFIGSADINFDGYNDLFLLTNHGVANAYANYWLFAPAKEDFAYLGNYPMFTVDSSNRQLSTYERGGHGGLIYQANHYRFIKGVLTATASEKQEATDRQGVYRKSIYRHKDGKLRLIKKETIRSHSTE